MVLVCRLGLQSSNCRRSRKSHLGGNDNVFNLMLALFSIGIAIGSVLCAKLSHERLILGLVTIGTLGLTVCGLLLVWLTQANALPELNGIIWFYRKPKRIRLCS